MRSTFHDEACGVNPWGTALVMAGAMAAGLATGRKGKLALITGMAAVAGINWMLRRKGTPWVAPLDSPTALIAQKAEPHDDVLAMSGAMSADDVVLDDAVPAIWEQGRNDLMSCGAVDAQTVWFEMPEPLPALPAQSEAHKLPPTLFCEDPTAGLDLLPMIPALGDNAGFDVPAASEIMASTGEMDALPALDPLPYLDKNSRLSGREAVEAAGTDQNMGALHHSPHCSTVPLAPIQEGQSGRLMMISAAVALVIAVTAILLGVFQQDGWVQGLKHHWQTVDGAAQNLPANDKSVSLTPVPDK